MFRLRLSAHAKEEAGGGEGGDAEKKRKTHGRGVCMSMLESDSLPSPSNNFSSMLASLSSSVP